MITNFPKPKGYNLGGLKSFQFATIHTISSFPAINNGIITNPIRFTAGQGWLDAYSTAYTLAFQEEASESEHGVFYTQNITGSTPGDKGNTLNAIHSAEGNSFVILITDANGQKRLVGGYGYPLVFLADFDSGANRADSKGFAFKFSGRSIFRAPIYKV